MKGSTIVFGYKLSNFLLKKGYKIESIKPHKTEVGILIFHFTTEDGIDTAIKEFKKMYDVDKISKESKDGRRK